MSKTYTTAGDLKVGGFVIIDGEPCRVVEISKAKTGKHGSAKASITAVGLLTKAKKVLVVPVDAQVEVPIVERKIGQVIADLGDKFQVMDIETFEVFEVPKDLIEKDLRNKIAVNMEVEYWQVLNTRIIVRPR
ncbi:MAG: translation initiation factor IF-5A [Desulfurococcaceae archaeon]|nr:translation initiation factor IF-5A [Desulfurococcaceae archaeon]MCC6052681.1 translation initiation factor IF-5A [Desulfurococcaceae archaeon]